MATCCSSGPGKVDTGLIDDRIGSFTLDMFSGRVGESFLIRSGDGGGLATQLIEATPVGEPARAGGRAPFSLVFRGRPDVVLPQRIYPIEHNDLGAFELFLVPIGPDEAGMRYEAVFT